MPQLWTDLSTTTSVDPLAHSFLSPVQLTDGTLVWIDYDGTNFYLKYTVDRSTVNTLATLTGYAVVSFPSILVRRDASNNLYVLGTASASQQTIRGQGFPYLGSHSWTTNKNPVVTSSLGLSNISAIDARWLNTGGGTSNAGHLFCIGGNQNSEGYISTTTLGAFTLDAGVLLAGSGTLLVHEYTNPTFLQSSGATNTPGFPMSLECDGVGATSGLAVLAMGTITGSVWAPGDTQVGSWGISNTGVLTTSAKIGIDGTMVGSTGRYRLLRYASGTWALLNQSSTGFNAAICTTSSFGTPVGYTPSGTHMDVGNWDAFLDPATPNRIWVRWFDRAQSSGQLNAYRVNCDFGTGTPVWGSTVVVDDTLTGLNTGGINTHAAVPWPVVNTADWMVSVQNTSTTLTVYGDATQFSTVQLMMVI